MKKYSILIVALLTLWQGLAQEKQITFTAVGDIMMGTSFPSVSYLPNKTTDPFAGVKEELLDTDILFGNHEGTLTDTGKNAKHCKDPSKCYSFKSPTWLAKNLETTGFDVMSIANNHIGDFGSTGIANTMKTLEQHGIEYAGVYSKPYTIFEKDSITYGFCAFAPNRDTPKLNQIQKAVATVKKLKDLGADIIIVSFHGGAEGSKHTHVTRKTEIFYGENRGNVYEFAHAMIDAGADIIVGHGPHVARAIEIYKDRFITYSLGNFCTYGRFSLSGVKGYAPIVKIKIDQEGKFISGKIISAKQKSRVYPYIDPESLAFKEIKRLTEADFPNSSLEFNEDGHFYLKQ
jgi:poly-gamma-glutamate capsule biosynthesis protein CapA/YwtB (metallophosphatase superfamily)